MRVVYTLEVVRELRAARQWYNARTPGTGERLVDLVDETVDKIADAPTMFPQDRETPNVRRARVPKYPYTLIFMVHDDVLVVLLALAHGRRKPGYWRRRLRLPSRK
jgi:plasmid stabilization system protein ParE